MKFVDLYSDAEDIANIQDSTNLVKRAAQRALDRAAGFHAWSFYLDFGWITTVDDITAGDADVTINSKSISSNHADTSWPAAIADGTSRKRKFRIQTQSAFYTIASRGGSTALTLDQVFQGATAADQSYRIYQDEYRLFGDVDGMHTFRQIEDGVLMLNADSDQFDEEFPTPDSNGNSLFAVPVGRRQDTYAGGTISATVGAVVITGVSTLWTSVQGLSRGNRIRIGTNVYTIKSVDSDTQLTIYESIVTTVSAGTAYTIFLDNLVIQVYEIPDSVKNLYYRYYRKPAPLVNDYDEPDLPPAYHWLLLHGTLSELWAIKGDDQRRVSADQTFLNGLVQMKNHYTSDRLYERRPSIIGYRARLKLRYPSNFDVAYSR